MDPPKYDVGSRACETPRGKCRVVSVSAHSGQNLQGADNKLVAKEKSRDLSRKDKSLGENLSRTSPALKSRMSTYAMHFLLRDFKKIPAGEFSHGTQAQASLQTAWKRRGPVNGCKQAERFSVAPLAPSIKCIGNRVHV